MPDPSLSARGVRQGRAGLRRGLELGFSKTPFHPTPEGQEAIADALLGPVVNKVLVREGSNVAVRTPAGPRARFAVVTTQGGFTANPLAPGAAPVPSAFLMREAWDLTAAAVFSGPATVSLPAQPGDSVWHYTGGRWSSCRRRTRAATRAPRSTTSRRSRWDRPCLRSTRPSRRCPAAGRHTTSPSTPTGSSVDGGGAIASYAWDFGDGASATGAAPVHRFAQSGTYEVTVRATSEAGAVDDATTTVAVTNPAPVAAIAGPVRATAGQPVAYSSAGSTDNGRLTEVAWYFGDGTENVIGAEATHAFSAAGTYLVGVVVQDDEGKAVMKMLEVQVDPAAGPRYAFEGFFAPVDNRPTINAVKAGQAVPVKFSLGGDFGLGIMETGYPLVHRVDCASGATLDEVETTVTAGSSSLSFSGGRYHYVWKTQKAWAGSCRRLVVGLDDGSRHTAGFRLR